MTDRFAESTSTTVLAECSPALTSGSMPDQGAQPSPNGQSVDGPEWPADQVQRLVDLRSQKVSFGKIASQLGITRNQAIGKFRRLVAAGRATPPPETEKRRPDRPAKREDEGAQRAFANGFVTLGNIGTEQCRYPEGDEAPFAFCGQPVREGSVYCEDHHKRCYVRSVKQWCRENREAL